MEQFSYYLLWHYDVPMEFARLEDLLSYYLTPTLAASSIPRSPELDAVLQLSVDDVDPAVLQSISVPSSTAPITHLEEIKYCVRYEGNDSKRWDGREI